MTRSQMPSDWADREAERLLPCDPECHRTYRDPEDPRMSHFGACLSKGRTGVAAALRAGRARSQRVVEAAEKLSDAIDMAEPYYPRELGAIIEHDKVLHAALAARKEAADAT